LTGSDETIFRGTQKLFFALTDKRFSNFGRSKWPKRGVLAVFGSKIETQLSEHLWWDFLTASDQTIFGGPKNNS
jgi:hypothetical protein